MEYVFTTDVFRCVLIVYRFLRYPRCSHSMDLLPDTLNCGLRMRRKCRESSPRHHELAIPPCIAARAWRTCRNACWDRYLAVTFAVDGGGNVPGIPGACATRNFTHLIRSPYSLASHHSHFEIAWLPWAKEVILNASGKISLCLTTAEQLRIYLTFTHCVFVGW